MDLIKQIFDSGVVGCGGAGFPTHVKLKASPEILIINGAECEPLLRTDRYLMIHEAEKLVSGVDLICRELSIPEGKLGANLHASISGTAHLAGNAITITEV